MAEQNLTLNVTKELTTEEKLMNQMRDHESYITEAELAKVLDLIGADDDSRKVLQDPKYLLAYRVMATEYYMQTRPVATKLNQTLEYVTRRNKNNIYRDTRDVFDYMSIGFTFDEAKMFDSIDSKLEFTRAQELLSKNITKQQLAAYVSNYRTAMLAYRYKPFATDLQYFQDSNTKDDILADVIRLPEKLQQSYLQMLDFGKRTLSKSFNTRSEQEKANEYAYSIHQISYRMAQLFADNPQILENLHQIWERGHTSLRDYCNCKLTDQSFTPDAVKQMLFLTEKEQIQKFEQMNGQYKAECFIFCTNHNYDQEACTQLIDIYLKHPNIVQMAKECGRLEEKDYINTLVTMAIAKEMGLDKDLFSLATRMTSKINGTNRYSTGKMLSDDDSYKQNQKLVRIYCSAIKLASPEKRDVLETMLSQTDYIFKQHMTNLSIQECKEIAALLVNLMDTQECKDSQNPDLLGRVAINEYLIAKQNSYSLAHVYDNLKKLAPMITNDEQYATEIGRMQNRAFESDIAFQLGYQYFVDNFPTQMNNVTTLNKINNIAWEGHVDTDENKYKGHTETIWMQALVEACENPQINPEDLETKYDGMIREIRRHINDINNDEIKNPISKAMAKIKVMQYDNKMKKTCDRIEKTVETQINEKTNKETSSLPLQIQEKAEEIRETAKDYAGTKEPEVAPIQWNLENGICANQFYQLAIQAAQIPGEHSIQDELLEIADLYRQAETQIYIAESQTRGELVKSLKTFIEQSMTKDDIQTHLNLAANNDPDKNEREQKQIQAESYMRSCVLALDEEVKKAKRDIDHEILSDSKNKIIDIAARKIDMGLTMDPEASVRTLYEKRQQEKAANTVLGLDVSSYQPSSQKEQMPINAQDIQNPTEKAFVEWKQEIDIAYEQYLEAQIALSPSPTQDYNLSPAETMAYNNQIKTAYVRVEKAKTELKGKMQDINQKKFDEMYRQLNPRIFEFLADARNNYITPQTRETQTQTQAQVR